MALQNLLCLTFGITRFMIIASSDVEGEKFEFESHDGTFCIVDVPQVYFAPANQADFSKFINSVRTFSPPAFLVSLPPVQAAMFLEQAYDLGVVLHEGVQILTDQRTTQKEIFSGFTKAAPVEAIMNGIISIEFWPEYFVHREGGKKFIQAWNQQANIILTRMSHLFKLVCGQLKITSILIVLIFHRWPLRIVLMILPSTLSMADHLLHSFITSIYDCHVS